MMYSEFLRMAGVTESYITYQEYTEEIEPIYMNCDLSKAEFIELLKETFEKLVYPTVEKAIHNLNIEEKALLIVNSRRIRERIETKEAVARMLAYKYMKLIV